MQWVVKAGDLLIATVNGQRVLNQVIGADRQEIQPPQEGADGQCCRRHFDHAANLDFFVEGDAFATQTGLGLLQRGQGQINLVRVRQHRHQEFDLAVFRGAQDGAQLRLEGFGLCQRQTDRAQAQRRIAAFARLALIRRQDLVVAQIEGADGHRPAFHALDHLAVGFELLVFAGHLALLEEDEFGTQEADAFRAVFQRQRHFMRAFDIGQQFDLDLVERRCPRSFQEAQLRAVDFELALLELVFLQHPRIGIDDDHAVRAVDDQRFLVMDQLTRIVQAEYRRNVHAAGQNGRVRGRATRVGDEGGKIVFAEGDHVGWREVMRDDNQVFALDALAQTPAGMAGQFAHHPFDYLAHVIAALTQIDVVDFLELFDQEAHLLDNRPFGVTTPLTDDLPGNFGKFRVGENHQVQVDKGAEVGSGHAGLEIGKILTDGRQRRIETRHLLFHPAWRNEQM